ncbi:hypothetical protein LCGC14_1910190 [marine sediment metagenome]|uniref:Uncharacterized protein n=1 Tax=marine sediment metagenome TaxID=412755 RepID=A0A0F9I7U1_9ZZZZ
MDKTDEIGITIIYLITILALMIIGYITITIKYIESLIMPFIELGLGIPTSINIFYIIFVVFCILVFIVVIFGVVIRYLYNEKEV